MTEVSPEHVPVLADAVVQYLGRGLPGPVVDCTVGLGGHAALLLNSDPNLRLVGLDVDEVNLAVAQKRLAAFGDRFRLTQSNFADLKESLAELGVSRVGGILADLGVSSNQLADTTRGLSFDADGPLDMRLDRRQRHTAADLINSLSEGELADLLYLQSQERHSRRIARRICQARRQGRLNSTLALARLVAWAVGQDPDSRRSRIHPATRTFLALRMAVNDEAGAIRRLLAQAPGCLLPGGRIAVISFHSGEDRIVKEDFRARADASVYEVLTRKPVVADEDELEQNPRSRSAKLRVAELLRAV